MAGNSKHIRPGGQKLHALNKEPVFSLFGALQVLYSWRFFIIIFTAVVAVIAFSVATSFKRNYEAVASLLINPRGIQVVDRDITPRNQTVDGNIAIIESQMRVLQSVKILKEVVETENLESDPEFNGSTKNPFKMFMSAIRGKKGSRNPADAALNNLREAVATHRPKLSYIVELSVLSKDAEKAARLANRIAETFLASESNMRASVTQGAADTLKERLDELGRELTEAENAVEQYKLENNILNTSGSLINEQELSQVNRSLIEARNATAAARVRLSEIKRLKSAGSLPQVLPEAVDSNTITQLRVQLSTASQRKISLSAQYLDTHPVMVAEELRLKDIRKSIQEELDRISAAAEIQYNNALGRERELEQKVANLTNRTYSTNDAQIRLRELEREANSKRVVYEAFLVRAKELGEQVRVNTNEARIISLATPPSDPTGISPKLGAVAATLGGFAAACAIALIGSAMGNLTGGGAGAINRTHVRPAGRSLLPARAKPASASNPVTEIFNRMRSAPAANDLNPAAEEAFRLPVLQTFSISRDDLVSDRLPLLVGRGAPASTATAFQETLRPVLAGHGARRPRKVLVTGFEDAFARTTFAANLALASAQAGHSTLLVGASEETDNARAEFAHYAENQSGLQSAVGHHGHAAVSDDTFSHWRMREFDSMPDLRRKILIEKLKDHLTGKQFNTELTVIDSPLLDGKTAIGDLVELCDEAFIVVPQHPGPGGIDASLFSKLGTKRNRVRGVIKVGYSA